MSLKLSRSAKLTICGSYLVLQVPATQLTLLKDHSEVAAVQTLNIQH